jgi:hypothetical protein
MSTKTKYTDEPLGEIKIVRDFLPSPAELAFSEESVKVTISLSKKSTRICSKLRLQNIILNISE